MDHPSLRCLRVEPVVVDKQPDGDSIRLVPAVPAVPGSLAMLTRAPENRSRPGCAATAIPAVEK